MAAPREFKLPDLGEGLTEGEILRWLVAPGDTVTLNQPLVEVETAKAAVEVPSPYAGVVVRLHAAEGDTVDVGSPIVTVDTDPGAGNAAGGQPSGQVETPPDAAGTLPPAPALASTEAVPPPAAPQRESVLVGYGPLTTPHRRRARRGASRPPDAVPEQPPSPARVSAAGVAARVVDRPVLAKPPVRKFARDSGVDLATVAGTGPGGVVTRSDVAAALAEPAPTGEPTGGERRVAVRGVRKLTAQNMVMSAFTAPHVTEFLTLDVTAGMTAVKALAASADFEGVRMTPLTLLARALLLAVRRHPEINSTWDEAAQEIVIKDYVNLGIAAATPRGLLVPNIKNAERLGLRELAGAITALTSTAREGRTPPADLTGGTITITNVGVFGVDTGTPILNPGESAILAFGVVADRPWVHEGELAVRKVTTLALSFDHRVVDGALGSAVLADVGAAFADPLRMLAWS